MGDSLRMATANDTSTFAPVILRLRLLSPRIFCGYCLNFRWNSARVLLNYLSDACAQDVGLPHKLSSEVEKATLWMPVTRRCSGSRNYRVWACILDYAMSSRNLREHQNILNSKFRFAAKRAKLLHTSPFLNCPR